jgi:hypothetical protein
MNETDTVVGTLEENARSCGLSFALQNTTAAWVCQTWVLGFTLRLHSDWQKRVADAPPWTKLPSKLEKLLSMFSCSVVVELGHGASARIWTDSWLPVRSIATFAPHLFRTIGRCFLLVSIKEVLSGHHYCVTSPGHTPRQCCMSLLISGKSWRTSSCNRLWVTALIGDGRHIARTQRPQHTAHSGHVLPVGSQGTLGSFRAAKGETLLLVSPAWLHLDGVRLISANPSPKNAPDPWPRPDRGRPAQWLGWWAPVAVYKERVGARAQGTTFIATVPWVPTLTLYRSKGKHCQRREVRCRDCLGQRASLRR